MITTDKVTEIFCILDEFIVKKQDCIYAFHDLIEAIDELIQKLMRDDRE